VLVPVDFSEPSRLALALLKEIPTTGKVILLHVVDKGESEEEIQATVQESKDKLALIKKDLPVSGIAVEMLVHVGYLPGEINATADRSDATLILISPQGEGWIRELRALFIGSTTDAVIRRAHCPVLITTGHTTG
jgi:nucleotide-binding universal stress UspA family protein